MTRIPYHIVLTSISIFIIIVLLLGVPVSWKDGLLIGVAVALIILAFAFHKENSDTSLSNKDNSSQMHAFRDSAGPYAISEDAVIISQDDDFIEEVRVIKNHSDEDEY